MVVGVHAVLMILAIVCFLLSAFPLSTWEARKESLIAVGLAFWALAVLIG